MFFYGYQLRVIIFFILHSQEPLCITFVKFSVTNYGKKK